MKLGFLWSPFYCEQTVFGYGKCLVQGCIVSKETRTLTSDWLSSATFQTSGTSQPSQGSSPAGAARKPLHRMLPELLKGRLQAVLLNPFQPGSWVLTCSETGLAPGRWGLLPAVGLRDVLAHLFSISLWGTTPRGQGMLLSRLDGAS